MNKTILTPEVAQEHFVELGAKGTWLEECLDSAAKLLTLLGELSITFTSVEKYTDRLQRGWVYHSPENRENTYVQCYVGRLDEHVLEMPALHPPTITMMVTAEQTYNDNQRTTYYKVEFKLVWAVDCTGRKKWLRVLTDERPGTLIRQTSPIISDEFRPYPSKEGFLSLLEPQL